MNLVPLARTGRRDQARHALLAFARANGTLQWLADEIVIAIIHMIGFEHDRRVARRAGIRGGRRAALSRRPGLAERADLTSPASIFPNLPEMPRLIEEHLKAATEEMSTSELTPPSHGRSIAEAAREGPSAKPGTPAMRRAGGRPAR